ncbi:acyl-CoA-like ligand-binding transcription factor [Streptomyces sp. JW3]|uniref:acyl-CoA-like ligand-binding transcription factor n=1 Tax=Streptomyces sp. JW3 TaxID=3456955 RepID=UPI003FA460EE
MPTRGRPSATSHAEIERCAFQLFAERGFEATTIEAIAASIGVSPRTVTRYYPSKNDIPWGQFDRTLVNFRDLLASMPTELPLWERVHRGIVAFNVFPTDAEPSHRDRMALIFRTPALQAHSVLRYAQWRRVIADYVASDVGADSGDLIPMMAGHLGLAIAVTAYEQWLEGTDELIPLLNSTVQELRKLLS